MALVNLTYDTFTKQLTVTMDGQPVENVKHVDFYVDYDDKEKFKLQMSTIDSSKKEDDGYVYQTMIYAKDSSNIPLDIKPFEKTEAFFKTKTRYLPSLAKIWRR